MLLTIVKIGRKENVFNTAISGMEFACFSVDHVLPKPTIENSILNLFIQDVVATQESQLLTAGPERPSSSAHPDEVNDNYIV